MKTISKNLLYNIVYQILVILIPLVTAPYVARTLGVTASGIYSYVNAIAYYFVLAAALGIGNHGNRSVAAVRDDRNKLSEVFWSIYLFQLTTSIISIVAYVIYILLFVGENKLIFVIQLLYVLSGAFDISWLFFGLEKFQITVTRNMLIKILTVVMIISFVKTPEDVWKYTLILSAGAFISQAYLWMYVKKYVDFTFPGFSKIYSNLKPALTLFIPVLAYSIYKMMDKIMIKNMSNYDEVGLYQNAEKIINIPMGIITALGTVMLPRMSNIMANGDSSKAKTYIKNSIELVTFLCSGIAFGIMGIARVLAPVYLGDAFEKCGPLIELLAISVFFIAWASVIRMQFLIPSHNDKAYIISTILGALTNLCINICLIPHFQSVGAAIGTILAEFVVMITQVLFVRKQISIMAYIFKALPFVLIGLVMMASVHFIGYSLGKSILTLVMQILAGAVIYLVLSLIFMAWTKNELYYYAKNELVSLRKRIHKRTN